jgi:hypothetical protein
VPREAIGQACATAVPGCLSVSEPTSDQPCCRATHHPIVRAPLVCVCDRSSICRGEQGVATLAHEAKTCAPCIFASGLRPSICDCMRAHHSSYLAAVRVCIKGRPRGLRECGSNHCARLPASFNNRSPLAPAPSAAPSLATSERALLCNLRLTARFMWSDVNG